jgi:tripartite-type tricarboxylate transporter receptor subunit TctC
MRAWMKTMLGAAAALGAATAFAQSYPSRTVKIVVPYPPGGGTDLVVRRVADHLRTEFGQPVVVENVPGAGGNISAGQVARAPGDGYTLLVTAAALAIAPAIGVSLPFDPAKDLVPIAQLATVPLLVLARTDSPLNSIAEVLAAAKQQPGKLTFASFGVGTPPHLVGESIKLFGKADITHAPYKGSAGAVVGGVRGERTSGGTEPLLTCSAGTARPPRTARS